MNLSSNYLRLNSGACFGQYRMSDQQFTTNVSMIDIYELPTKDLTPYTCLIIDGLVDQEFLYKHRAIIRDFLNEGKVLVFSGNLFRNWLPGGSPFVPKEITSYRDYEVSIHQPHPIFEGVLRKDMTYKKGVSGFFARGHHPLPPNAEVLLTLPGNVPITYIDRHSTKGTIVVHVGHDLFNYVETENSTARIRQQLMQWIDVEYESLQEMRYVR